MNEPHSMELEYLMDLCALKPGLNPPRWTSAHSVTSDIIDLPIIWCENPLFRTNIGVSIRAPSSLHHVILQSCGISDLKLSSLADSGDETASRDAFQRSVGVGVDVDQQDQVACEVLAGG